MYLLIIVILALCIVIFLLLGKIYFLHKSALEIGEGLEERLASDTNTLIDISSRDACARQLASYINAQLRLLRQQRHRYQTGDRELKEAVTGISHDLRTPLTAIRGYLDLMDGTTLSQAQQRYLGCIRNRAEAMTDLTGELFRYTLSLLPERLHLEPVCLNAALEESLAAFYAPLTARGIRPTITMTGQSIVKPLDPEALSRIFGNILSNVLKYSGGDLTVTLENTGTIRFSNAAPGLTQVQVGQLFDRYFTLEAGQGGCGLGLSIARNLAEQLGGTLSARLEGGILQLTLVWREGNG